MVSYELSPVETRVLGCLLEKERTTPENYPLSLNSLMLACNQSTNREPVMAVDEKALEDALWELRQKKLVLMLFTSGSRVQKYRHTLLEHFTFEPGEMAILAVLLLRGPQTPGELRARTERLYGFPSIEEVERALNALSKGDDPVIRLLPPRPGQKERRYVQLLSGEPVETPYVEPEPTGSSSAPRVSSSSRLEALESEVSLLKEAIAKLSEEFASFRKQFE